MREELDKYETMYQWSSSPFEGHHRRLQININQNTSNSSIVVIDRFALMFSPYEDVCLADVNLLKFRNLLLKKL